MHKPTYKYMYARRLVLSVSVFAFVAILISCGRETKTEFFKRFSKQYSDNNCPSRYVDGITTLDSIVFVDDGDKGVQLVCFSVNVDSLERQRMIEKKDEIMDLNLSVLRNSVVFAKQKEEGVRFKYVYYDSSRKDKIIECEYTAKDYQ